MYGEWMDDIDLNIDLSNYNNITRKEKYKLLKALLEKINNYKNKRKIKKI